MAAKDNLSSQFVTLYRGLNRVRPEEISQRGLGSHWTPDLSVASHFAFGSHSDYESSGEPEQGTIVEAKVHKRHIIQPESEEWQGWNEGEQVFGPEHPEQEHTVRPGGIVHVTNMWDVGEDENYRNIERQVKPQHWRGWRA